MALAILRFLDGDNNQYRFQVDLGSNKFYQYYIGAGAVRRSNGIPRLDQLSYVSPLMGPIPDHPLGQTTLDIPASRFSPQQRAIQIMSFRNQHQFGPAVSEIVTVPNLVSSNPNPPQSVNSLPALSLGLELSMKPPSPVETVAFRYREVAPVSAAMATAETLDKVKTMTQKAATVTGKPAMASGMSAANDTLVDNLGTLLPKLAGIIGAVLPKLSQEAVNHPQTGHPINREEVARLLESLLQQIGAPPASSPTAVSQGMSYQSLRTAPVRQLSHRDQPLTNRFGAASALMTRPRRSSLLGNGSYGAGVNGKSPDDGMALGAVSMLLAALLPALLKITPDLLQMLGMRLMPTFSQVMQRRTLMAGQMSVAMGLVSQQQENEAVMMALGLAMAAAATADLTYQRLDGVELSFSQGTPLLFKGRDRLVYQRNRDIAFPLKIKIPKPIPKARLQLLIKHPQTLEILIEENVRVENVNAGELPVVPQISREKLRRLAVNQEYLVCATLVWPGKNPKTQQPKRLGTSTMQLIMLVGEYGFDRIEPVGEAIPLNDVNRFRQFWHKVWEGEFESVVRQITLDCKYYYALEPDRNSLARMETVMQFDKTRAVKIAGRIKSGLIADVYSLNALIPEISAYPALGQAELEALMTPEFQEKFSHVAHQEVQFEGKQGDKVALWVYPEMKLQRVWLKQVGQANAHGLVLGLTEREVYVPMPAIVHFIGIASAHQMASSLTFSESLGYDFQAVLPDLITAEELQKKCRPKSFWVRDAYDHVVGALEKFEEVEKNVASTTDDRLDATQALFAKIRGWRIQAKGADGESSREAKELLTSSCEKRIEVLEHYKKQPLGSAFEISNHPCIVDAIYSDLVLREQFRDFVTKEFSSENFLFYENVKKYKNASPDDRKIFAEAIVREFIGEDADKQINIRLADQEKEPLKSTLKHLKNMFQKTYEFDAALFDPVLDVIKPLVVDDTFRRYEGRKHDKEIQERIRVARYIASLVPSTSAPTFADAKIDFEDVTPRTRPI